MARRSRYDSMAEALTDAKIASLHERLNAIDASIKLVAHQAEEKNKELNDVRHRFIPREVFERFAEDQSKRFELFQAGIDQYRVQQQARTRALVIAMAPMALGVVGLALRAVGR